MNSLLLSQIPKDILFSIRKIDFDAPTQECTNEIDKLLGKTVLIGGKRLRPLLTLLMGRLFNLEINDLKDHAKAIEFIHAASLAHDDVVDNATLRRGKTSINVLAGNKKAVLAGDYLLSSVIVSLSGKGNLSVLKKTAEVIAQLAKGEWIQHDAAITKVYTREIIENIARFKTASVMSWCCVIPAMISQCENGVEDRVVNWCNLFGEKLGIAFQLIDDTLDFSDNLQKDFFLDFDNGVVNSVFFEWMSLNPKLRDDFRNNTVSIDQIFSYDGKDQALDLVKLKSGELILECHALLDLICEHLLELHYDNKELHKSKKALKAIVDYISKRSY